MNTPHYIDYVICTPKCGSAYRVRTYRPLIGFEYHVKHARTRIVDLRQIARMFVWCSYVHMCSCVCKSHSIRLAYTTEIHLSNDSGRDRQVICLDANNRSFT